MSRTSIATHGHTTKVKFGGQSLLIPIASTGSDRRWIVKLIGAYPNEGAAV
jgi:hypothetical protein